MQSDLILSIFSIYSLHLPSGWQVLRIFYKFDETSSMLFVDYADSNGTTIKPPSWLDAANTIAVGELLENFALTASLNQDNVSHLELHVDSQGKFESRLGYGLIDWENMWPDDLTAITYTYEERGPAF